MMKSAKTDAYYTHCRPEILPFVPEECRRVMEVGCGSGVFASGLRQHRQIEEYRGVEPHGPAAAAAAAVLDKVHCGTLGEVFGDLPLAYFDCVIMNDVLEHIVDTAGTLGMIYELLREGGWFVASIPNVRYIENLKELLLDADWRYREEGILDSTHLRFFTRKSLTRTLEENGFAIEQLSGINKIAGRRYTWLNRLAFNRLEDTLYLQFGLRAKKQSRANGSA